MIKNAQLIRLFTQSALAFILLFSPISGRTGSLASAHPKINIEWVFSTPLLKSVSKHYKKHNQNSKVNISNNYQVSTFAPVGKIKSDRTEWLNQSQPLYFLQKTIPLDTEEELIA